MMRVALVTCSVPLGGSTTFTLFLASALRTLGIPAEVFSFTSQNPLAEEFATANIAVHTHNEKRLIYEDRLGRVYSELRAFKPTAVIAVLGIESFEILRYVPPAVARLGVFHDWAINPRVIGPRYRSVMDHLIVVASYLRDEMRRVDPDFPCSYLVHGIPLSAEAPSRATNLDSPLRLLYYGRLENASKGVRLFPAIASALKRRRIPFHWTIHGSGPEEAFLRNAFDPDLQSGTIRFSAPVRSADLAAIVRAHDVYILASTNEGGPLTLLESMALGLVPVCGDIPCLIQEVINDTNGFRVPRDHPDSYAGAIERLHQDRNLLEHMSEAAKKTVTAEYSAEAMARRYVRLLESLATPNREAVWPKAIKVHPILGQGSYGFSAPARGLRRIVKALRSNQA